MTNYLVNGVNKMKVVKTFLCSLVWMGDSFTFSRGNSKWLTPLRLLNKPKKIIALHDNDTKILIFFG